MFILGLPVCAGYVRSAIAILPAIVFLLIFWIAFEIAIAIDKKRNGFVDLAWLTDEEI